MDDVKSSQLVIRSRVDNSRENGSGHLRKAEREHNQDRDPMVQKEK